MQQFTKAIVTVFGLGLSPKAPGTVGSAGGLFLWWANQYLWNHPGTLYNLIAAAGILSALFVPLYLKNSPKKDPQEVVIDEVLGQLIALLPCGNNVVLGFLAFALFRLFDIWKPWPINKIDQLSGSPLKNTVSLIFDDVAAGLFAAVIILFAKNFF